MRPRFLNCHSLACVLAISIPLVATRPACARPRAEGVSQRHSRPSPAGAQQRMDPRSWFARGQTALQSGDLDAAEAAFRQVLAADPRAGSAYANLGVIAMRRKEWDHAITLLQKAEKLEPNMAGIRLNIGLVEYRRGNYRPARAPPSSVRGGNPGSQHARDLVGLCSVFTEHYAGAETGFLPL